MDLRVEAEERVKRMSDINAYSRILIGSGQSPLWKSSGRFINSPDGNTSYGGLYSSFSFSVSIFLF